MHEAISTIHKITIIIAAVVVVINLGEAVETYKRNSLWEKFWHWHNLEEIYGEQPERADPTSHVRFGCGRDTINDMPVLQRGA